MAEEAFALSPISARASLPSEADYDAIREAFMETSRGRWFLSEYAKRNRNADTTMVLDAVARIEQNLAAQKQAPANELIESLGAIRAIVGEARASVAQAIAGLAGGETLKAAHGGARIIREIAWTLRECGADVRICELLDAQVGAIDSGHRQIAAISSEAILATFDHLMRRIGDLAGDVDAVPPAEAGASVAEQVASPSSTAAKSPPAATIQEAVVKVAAALIPEPAETAIQADAPAEAAAPPLLDAGIEPAPATEAAAHTEIVSPPETAADVAFEPQAEAAAHLEIGRQANAVAHAAVELEAEHAAYSEPAAPQPGESAIQQPDRPAMRDPETAQEEAVLDLVALEMAAEDFAGQAIAESRIEPAPIQSNDPEPAIAADVDLTSNASSAAIDAAEATHADEASTSVLSPSLGAALISGGVIPKPAVPGIDPLAPIRRMTQIEKIAFFS
jgi:hypothetical protein